MGFFDQSYKHFTLVNYDSRVVTVRLTSCLTSLDLTKQGKLLFIQQLNLNKKQEVS